MTSKGAPIARRRSLRGWLTTAAVLVVGVLIGVAALREPAKVEFVPSGAARPRPADGAFPAASEAEFEGILVGLRGTPVIVNVWASWCAPCRTEMPLLQRAATSYRDRAVVLGVASKDDPNTARAFLDDLGLTYPNVFDLTGEIRTNLGVTAYPTTYVFDADGKLQTTVAGGISEQRLAAVIEAALP